MTMTNRQRRESLASADWWAIENGTRVRYIGNDTPLPGVTKGSIGKVDVPPLRPKGEFVVWWNDAGFETVFFIEGGKIGYMNIPPAHEELEIIPF